MRLKPPALIKVFRHDKHNPLTDQIEPVLVQWVTLAKIEALSADKVGDCAGRITF